MNKQTATSKSQLYTSMGPALDEKSNIDEREPRESFERTPTMSSSGTRKERRKYHCGSNKASKKAPKKAKISGNAPATTTTVGKRTTNQSKVPHDAPMGKKDIYFSLDCEMVGIGPGGYESALARVSIVNWENEVVLDKFVRVPVPVTDFRTFVSGVKKEDIESRRAIPKDRCRTLVQNILRGKILIGHGLQNDLDAIGITHPPCDMRDTATYAPYMKLREVRDGRILVPKRLKELAADTLGIQIQLDGKSHSSVEDATAALKLYKTVRNEWEALMSMKVMQSAMEDFDNDRAEAEDYHHNISPLYHPILDHQIPPMMNLPQHIPPPLVFPRQLSPHNPTPLLHVPMRWHPHFPPNKGIPPHLAFQHEPISSYSGYPPGTAVPMGCYPLFKCKVEKRDNEETNGRVELAKVCFVTCK